VILPSGIELLLFGIPCAIYLILQVSLFRMLPNQKRFWAVPGLLTPCGAMLIWTRPPWLSDGGWGLAWVLMTAGVVYLWGWLFLDFATSLKERRKTMTSTTPEPGCVFAILVLFGLLLIPLVLWTLIQLGWGDS